MRLCHRSLLKARSYNGELKQLLKWQEKNIGFTKGGIVYRMAAKRMSGEVSTAGENSLANVNMIDACCRWFFGKKATFSVDGDDSYIIIEKELWCENMREAIPEFFLQLGFVTVVETADTIQQAEFCQSRLIYTKLGPVMVRNPRKLLDVLVKCPRAVDPEQAKLVLAASALGELMQHPGIPVISVAAACLLRYAGGIAGMTTPDVQGRFEVYRTNFLLTEVDESARLQFEDAWGIDVQTQLALEAYYENLCPKWEGGIHVKKVKDPKMDNFVIWDDLEVDDDLITVDKWWRNNHPIGKWIK